MKRVDQDNSEIGSRPSGMPGGLMDSGMQIEHVGNVATGNGKK
jgi:hypothetical protein